MNRQEGTTEPFASDRATIAANIIQLRKRLTMSQTALAEAMQTQGLSHWRQNTVSRIETGKQELSLREYEALERILGPIWRGTDFADTMKESTRRLVNWHVTGKLEALEDSLAASLDEVRRLKRLFDGSEPIVPEDAEDRP